jgi:RNA polymerase sigma-70 factor (ECF subfamily)
MDMASPTTSEHMAKLMRADGGRLLAALMAELRNFQLAEDCLQEAWASAAEHWARTGLPASPQGWLLQVARRKAIDHFRRSANFNAKQKELSYLMELDQRANETPQETDEIPDERLRLIFTCCHPALEETTRIALTLRSLGGLTTAEIARAFLASEQAMAQRLVRAKHKIAAAGIRYEVPEREDWPARIESVLEVIYLIFNEGYASRAEPYMRLELCDEAIRLARLLLVLKPQEPAAEGLLALMLLHLARAPARLSADGALVPLDEQDRRLWSKALIAEGLPLVEQALRRGQPEAYQIQAAISALHVQAATFEQTDWAQIAALYGELARHKNNPVIEINRIAALAQSEGPARGLALLQNLEPDFATYQPFHALKADLLRRLGAPQARAAYQVALTLTRNEPERRFLERRKAALA